MLATEHQGKGYGELALNLVVDILKEQGKKYFDTSCVLGEGSPQKFYENYGFKNIK